MNDITTIDPRFLYEQVRLDAIKAASPKAGHANFKQILQKEIEKKKLKEAAYQMESIFINMMFKEMRKGLNQHRLIPENPAENIFTDMLYQEYSTQLAKSDKFGLAEMIYDQYSKYL